ncbi:MAG: molybdopterin-dependent oxidoreductase [Candidatus Atribacteria bacterium]|nr:molybdopterin-dependent oxidoreductase [Candidatus Atribacteria bacterium]
MKNSNLFFSEIKKIILLVIVLATITTLNIFANQENQPIVQLEPVEIREYQGERLSSLNDFNENAIKGTQRVDINEYILEIVGLVQETKKFSYNEIINNFNHYKKVATLDCVEGWLVKILWEGILVKDLIGKDNIMPKAKIIIFHAYDGYTTSFPINYIFDNNILLAYKANEIILPSDRGFPFMLVAESKWGYKWIKWITKIEISDDETFRGFWESRGYANEGDIDKSYFEK